MPRKLFTFNWMNVWVWQSVSLLQLNDICFYFQFWAAYVPCEAQYKDAVQITLEQIDVIDRLTDRYPTQMKKCSSVYGNLMILIEHASTQWIQFDKNLIQKQTECNELFQFAPVPHNQHANNHCLTYRFLSIADTKLYSDIEQQQQLSCEANSEIGKINVCDRKTEPTYENNKYLLHWWLERCNVWTERKRNNEWEEKVRNCM